MSTVNVTVTTANITASSTNANITVGSTNSVITVSNVASLANANVVRNALSVTDTGGDGSLSYDTSSGVFTYTGPNQTEANARIAAAPTQVIGHFSNVSPVNLEANGQISVDANALFSGKTTDDLAQGTTNKYFTTSGANVNTDALTEGSTNLYFTSARANSAIDNRLTGGDGIDYAVGTISVDSSVFRTSSDTAADSTFTGNTSIAGNLLFSGADISNNIYGAASSGKRNSFKISSAETGSILRANSTNVGYNTIDSEWRIQGQGNVILDPFFTSTNKTFNIKYATNKLEPNAGNTLVYVKDIFSVVTGNASSNADNVYVEISDRKGANVASATSTSGGGELRLTYFDTNQHGNLIFKANTGGFAGGQTPSAPRASRDANVDKEASFNPGFGGDIFFQHYTSSSPYSTAPYLWLFNNGTSNQGHALSNLAVVDSNIILSNTATIDSITTPLITKANSTISITTSDFGAIDLESGNIQLGKGSFGSNVDVLARTTAMNRADKTTWPVIFSGRQAADGTGSDNTRAWMYADGMGKTIFDLDSAGIGSSSYTQNSFAVQKAGAELFAVSYSGNANVAANLHVAGNLEVTGNINYREVEDLLVRDQTITMNFGNASAQTSEIIVDRSGSSASNTLIRWDESADKWKFSNDGSTFYDLSTSTDDLAEGSTNLYFTPARVRGNISGSGNIFFDQSSGVISEALTTTDIVEGDNLYYTVARANTAIEDRLDGFTSNITTTANIQLNDNAFLKLTSGNISANVDTMPRISWSEPTFFSDQDKQPRHLEVDLAGGTGAAKYNFLSFADSTNYDPTPSGDTRGVTLFANDHLNLISQQTGTTGGIQMYNGGNNASNGNLVFSSQPLDPGGTRGQNIGSGVQFYTDVGANANIQSSGSVIASYFHGDGSNISGITAAFSNADANNWFTSVDTDNLTEGSSNLYFTAARSRGNISVTDSGGDGSLAYNSGTGVITYTGPSAAETRAHISVTDAGGLGSAAYDSGTGVITYTGPADSDVRGLISTTSATASGGGSLAYDSSTGVLTFAPAVPGIALTDLSVTTATPSGNGALAYNNGTGVFTFTPADASASTPLSAGKINLGSTSDTTIQVTPDSNFTTTANAFSLSTSLTDVNTIATESSANLTLKPGNLMVRNTTKNGVEFTSSIVEDVGYEVFSTFGYPGIYDIPMAQSAAANSNIATTHVGGIFCGKTGTATGGGDFPLNGTVTTTAGSPYVTFTGLSTADADGNFVNWGTGTPTGKTATNLSTHYQNNMMLVSGFGYQQGFMPGGFAPGTKTTALNSSAADGTANVTMSSNATISQTYNATDTTFGTFGLIHTMMDTSNTSSTTSTLGIAGIGADFTYKRFAIQGAWMTQSKLDGQNGANSSTLSNIQGSFSSTSIIDDNSNPVAASNYTFTSVNNVFAVEETVHNIEQDESSSEKLLPTFDRFPGGLVISGSNKGSLRTRQLPSDSLNNFGLNIYHDGLDHWKNQFNGGGSVSAGMNFFQHTDNTFQTTASLITRGGPRIMLGQFNGNALEGAENWYTRDNMEIGKYSWYGQVGTTGVPGSTLTPTAFIQATADGDMTTSDAVSMRHIARGTDGGKNAFLIYHKSNTSIGSKDVISFGAAPTVSTGNLVADASAVTSEWANVKSTGISTGGTVSATTLTGTLSTAAQTNITSVGTLSALTVSGTNTSDVTVLKKFNETVVALGSVSGDQSSALNATNGSIYTLTATGDITINTIANAVAGTSMTIKIIQDGTGSRALTSSMKFVGGSKTLSTAAGAIDVISVVYDGTDYLASLTKAYA